MEEEKIEIENKENMYNTLYERAIDVMDSISDSDFQKEWKGNEFFCLLDWKFSANDVVDRMKNYLNDEQSWDKTTAKQVILNTMLDLHNSKIDEISPNAMVIVVTGKYNGEEHDLSDFWSSNIFYYGPNSDRFVRFFKKFGLAVKL